jgi:hypothetical protein
MTSDMCNTCGSSKIMTDLTLVDLGHGNAKNDLSIQIQTTDRVVFNKFQKGIIKANVCGSCGKIELSVSNPQELWEAYNKNKTL